MKILSGFTRVLVVAAMNVVAGGTYFTGNFRSGLSEKRGINDSSAAKSRGDSSAFKKSYSFLDRGAGHNGWYDEQRNGWRWRARHRGGVPPFSWRESGGHNGFSRDEWMRNHWRHSHAGCNCWEKRFGNIEESYERGMNWLPWSGADVTKFRGGPDCPNGRLWNNQNRGRCPLARASGNANPEAAGNKSVPLLSENECNQQFHKIENKGDINKSVCKINKQRLS